MSERASRIGLDDVIHCESDGTNKIVGGLTRLLAGSSSGGRNESRGVLEQIRSILELLNCAGEHEFNLKAVVEARAKVYRRTLERACVDLLQQNRRKERAVRWAAQTLTNMGSAKARFRGRIRAINATASEIASEAGRQFLAGELTCYLDRNGPHESRAFLVVHGWCGTASDLHKLARVAHEQRCMLITDGPRFDSIMELRRATAAGGALEQLSGEQTFHRRAVVRVNEGQVRRRFRGQYAREKRRNFVPLSGPWFGSHLEISAAKVPSEASVANPPPIPGVFGLKFDLRPEGYGSPELYSRHRVSVALPAGDERHGAVVVAPVTLSKAGAVVPSGTAMLENQVIRYAEWIVNRFAVFDDLERTAEVVRARLARFMTLNSGTGRLFRHASRTTVSTDTSIRALVIEFFLLIRGTPERIVIRLRQPVKTGRLGQVTAFSSDS